MDNLCTTNVLMVHFRITSRSFLCNIGRVEILGISKMKNELFC